MNRGPPTLRLRTETFAHHHAAWSPFYPDRFAIASAQNFGLVGNGRLHVATLDAKAGLGVGKFFETQDGLYDCAWSELHENHIVTASGDGTVKLWDVTLNDYPIKSWAEHTREIYSVDWSNLRKDLFATGSWDASIRLWTPEQPTSVGTIPLAHSGCVYRARFSPHSPELLASCGADGRLHIFDIRTAPTAHGHRPQIAISAHPNEALSLDWNKYAPNEIATSSVDRTVRIHDIRNPTAGPTRVLLGHGYAVRDVAYSPHRADRIATASYDMTARIWDCAVSGQALQVHNEHTEFVVGVSWALFDEGVVATCGWDAEVHVWRTLS